MIGGSQVHTFLKAGTRPKSIHKIHLLFLFLLLTRHFTGISYGLLPVHLTSILPKEAGTMNAFAKDQ